MPERRSADCIDDADVAEVQHRRKKRMVFGVVVFTPRCNGGSNVAFHHRVGKGRLTGRHRRRRLRQVIVNSMAADGAVHAIVWRSAANLGTATSAAAAACCSKRAATGRNGFLSFLLAVATWMVACLGVKVVAAVPAYSFLDDPTAVGRRAAEATPTAPAGTAAAAAAATTSMAAAAAFASEDALRSRRRLPGDNAKVAVWTPFLPAPRGAERFVPTQLERNGKPFQYLNCHIDTTHSEEPIINSECVASLANLLLPSPPQQQQQLPLLRQQQPQSLIRQQKQQSQELQQQLQGEESDEMFLLLQLPEKRRHSAVSLLEKNFNALLPDGVFFNCSNPHPFEKRANDKKPEPTCGGGISFMADPWRSDYPTQTIPVFSVLKGGELKFRCLRKTPNFMVFARSNTRLTDRHGKDISYPWKGGFALLITPFMLYIVQSGHNDQRDAEFLPYVDPKTGKPLAFGPGEPIHFKRFFGDGKIRVFCEEEETFFNVDKSLTFVVDKLRLMSPLKKPESLPTRAMGFVKLSGLVDISPLPTVTEIEVARKKPGATTVLFHTTVAESSEVMAEQLFKLQKEKMTLPNIVQMARESVEEKEKDETVSWRDKHTLRKVFEEVMQHIRDFNQAGAFFRSKYKFHFASTSLKRLQNGSRRAFSVLQDIELAAKHMFVFFHFLEKPDETAVNYRDQRNSIQNAITSTLYKGSWIHQPVAFVRMVEDGETCFLTLTMKFDTTHVSVEGPEESEAKSLKLPTGLHGPTTLIFDFNRLFVHEENSRYQGSKDAKYEGHIEVQMPKEGRYRVKRRSSAPRGEKTSNATLKYKCEGSGGWKTLQDSVANFEVVVFDGYVNHSALQTPLKTYPPRR